LDFGEKVKSDCVPHENVLGNRESHLTAKKAFGSIRELGLDVKRKHAEHALDFVVDVIVDNGEVRARSTVHGIDFFNGNRARR
jgi:hypothetical protein